MKSILSILWLLEHGCLRIIQCLVCQFCAKDMLFFQHTLDNSPFLLEVVPIQAKGWDFVQLLYLFILPSRNISQRIFEHVLPYRRTTQPSLREVSPTLVLLQLLQQIFVIRTFLCSSMMISFGLHSRWMHPKFSWSSRNRTSSKYLSHKRQASGWSCKCRSRRTTGSPMFNQDLGHLCRTVKSPATSSEKQRTLKKARFASAITCSFGIKPRSSLRLTFWRDSPDPSHWDFNSLKAPPALTAPHCVQKNTFSCPCSKARWWLTCMVPGNFSSVRVTWFLKK